MLDNSWLFDLLKQRGDAIKWKKWPELKKLNAKLRYECLKQQSSLITPNKAYITFENEFTLNKMKALESCNVLNLHTEVESAPEPSDINWQNKS